ncbi:uncharacterized protein PAC_12889 [Phialocephala subalpina]|uniref:Uncharacterized protein n=1 Tax=Phialocephala subalpina TaxID=576137 RepID=A0A1L7XD94_9HELO|nr:uncharacterized protein PAC_12889 [Phialocephala subalpina]
MHRSRGRNDFFPSLLLGGRSLEKGLETRIAWREAEIITLNKLCRGFHPDHLELQVRRELSRSSTSSYRYLFLDSALRILTNMRRSNQFGGLPTLAEYERIIVIRPRRRSFEMMMYERFTDPAVVRQYGGDYGMSLEAGKPVDTSHSLRSNIPPDRAGSLDREYEATLQEIREQEHKRVEEQYRANEEELRAELADAKFRAESAEARLDIQQQRLGSQPRQPANPTHQNYIRDTPPQDRNYQRDRSRYAPTEGGRSLRPDDMRSERSFRPGFDDQGMPESKSREVPNQPPDERRMSEFRYIDGPRPNRDRAVPPTSYSRYDRTQAQNGRRCVPKNPEMHILGQQLAIREKNPRNREGPRRQDHDGRSASGVPTRREHRLDGPRDEQPRDDGQRRRDREDRSIISSSTSPTESSRHEHRPSGPRVENRTASGQYPRDRDDRSEIASSTRRPEDRREGPSDRYRERSLVVLSAAPMFLTTTTRDWISEFAEMMGQYVVMPRPYRQLPRAATRIAVAGESYRVLDHICSWTPWFVWRFGLLEGARIG